MEITVEQVIKGQIEGFVNRPVTLFYGKGLAEVEIRYTDHSGLKVTEISTGKVLFVAENCTPEIICTGDGYNVFSNDCEDFIFIPIEEWN